MFPMLAGYASFTLLPTAQWATMLRSAAPMAATLLDLAALTNSTPSQRKALLDAAELARYQGFQYPKRRQEWLGGRIAAKAAVTQLLTGIGLAPPPSAALAIANDHTGKPHITWPGLPHAVHLSISHSHGQAAAMAGFHPCGIDLQQVTATVARVKERFAAAEEEKILAEVLGAHPEIIRLTLLWSAKEALRKLAPTPPLPGFFDTLLVDIQPADTTYLFLFSAPKICHNAPLRVVASLLGEYALAASILPLPCPNHDGNAKAVDGLDPLTSEQRRPRTA